MANPPIHDHSYRQFLRDKKLMGSRCTGCGAQYVPPRDVCAACHEGTMEWVQMRGAGSLSAYPTISIGTPNTVAEGYDRNNPYCCAVVALEEGPRVVARLQGVDAGQPETIAVGAPLELVWQSEGEAVRDTPTLVFRPRVAESGD